MLEMKIYFEDQFMPAILERGYTYFSENHVHDVIVDDNTYSATILGNEIYETSVTVENNTVISMECDCPFASEHGNCKHMAALCYTIESSIVGIKYEEQIKKLIASLTEEEMCNILIKLCKKEENYDMVKNMQKPHAIDDLLLQQIDDLLEQLQYPLNYNQMMKCFNETEKIINKLHKLSTADQFPYLLSLMELKNLDENENFYEFYEEVKEMFYDGIYDEEPIYLDWFWEQMSHPSTCDDDIWDIFYELFDTDTCMIHLKNMLSNCENKEDKKILQQAIDSCN